MATDTMSLDVSVGDPLAALKRAGAGRGGSRMRRVALVAVVVGIGVAVSLAAPRVLNVFADAFERALNADPRWVIAGVAFELVSFAGYIALFWHVASRTSPRVGLRASAEVALASTAATRLLPTAGAGGAALTFWSLRRAGQSSRAATGTLLTFLVILYSVFLGSLLVAGTLLASGAVHSDVSFELSAVPAIAAGAAIAIALMLALLHRRHRARGEVSRARPARTRGAAHALGSAVHDALALVRRPDARLAGGVAWWGFDMAVLWATFSAFGTPPSPVVLVLGYFIGQVANTVPLPGAASGGMVGAFLALGMPAEVVLPAVLAYRAIAIWTPVPAGAVALGGLRRTVQRWAAEDGIVPDEADERRDPEPAAAPKRVLVVQPLKSVRLSGPWSSSARAVIASTTRRSSSTAGAACSPMRSRSRSNAAVSSR
jgi:uncharacterized membrane protein YbhN (UPF0104 family)